MRIPVTTKAIRLTAAVTLVVAAAACEDKAGGGTDSVTIPASDGSSPSIVMDAHFNVEQRPFLTITNGSAPQQATVKPGETVSFIANGSDTDGGVKTVEIWVTKKTCSVSGDLASCSGPGLVGGPAVSNPDPDPNKTPGQTAAASRIVKYDLRIPTGAGTGSLEAKVWAKVVNWDGDKVESPQITITEPL
jgi:hypothetical protein